MTKAQDSQSNKIMETVRKEEEIVESYTVTKLTRKQIYDEVWSISISGNIALYNGQVKYILKDIDVTAFYRKLLKSIRKLSESAQAVKNILDDNEE